MRGKSSRSSSGRRSSTSKSKSKSGRKSSTNGASKRSSSGSSNGESKRYGRTASKKVGRAMHEMKEGKLRSGRSKKKVTDRKQAIAIGLSEARRRGAKVPERANSR